MIADLLGGKSKIFLFFSLHIHILGFQKMLDWIIQYGFYIYEFRKK